MKKNQINENGLEDGYWEYYFSTGILSRKGHFNNGQYVGYWEWYYYSGKLWYKCYHI